MIGYILIGVLVLIFYKPVMNFIIRSKKKEFDRLTNDPKYQSILKKYNIKPVPYGKNSSLEELRELQEKRKLKKEKEVTKRHGKTKGKKIMKGELWMGMSNKELLSMRGKPQDVIKKVSRGKKREEYFYDGYKNRQGNMSYKFRVVLIDGKVDGWNDIKK